MGDERCIVKNTPPAINTAAVMPANNTPRFDFVPLGFTGSGSAAFGASLSSESSGATGASVGATNKRSSRADFEVAGELAEVRPDMSGAPSDDCCGFENMPTERLKRS